MVLHLYYGRPSQLIYPSRGGGRGDTSPSALRYGLSRKSSVPNQLPHLRYILRPFRSLVSARLFRIPYYTNTFIACASLDPQNRFNTSLARARDLFTPCKWPECPSHCLALLRSLRQGPLRPWYFFYTVPLGLGVVNMGVGGSGVVGYHLNSLPLNYDRCRDPGRGLR